MKRNIFIETMERIESRENDWFIDHLVGLREYRIRVRYEWHLIKTVFDRLSDARLRARWPGLGK